MITLSSMHSQIIAIDGSNLATCPLVTFDLQSNACCSPLRVTLELCEWQRVAQDIAQAAEALGHCLLGRCPLPWEAAS